MKRFPQALAVLLVIGYIGVYIWTQIPDKAPPPPVVEAPAPPEKKPAPKGFFDWMAESASAGLDGLIDRVEAAQEEEREEAKKMGLDRTHEAYSMMRVFVERRLKAPGEAEFPNPLREENRDHVRRVPGKLDEYFVRSYVDSENSFGARVRTRFAGRLEYLGDSKWSLLQLEFDE